MKLRRWTWQQWRAWLIELGLTILGACVLLALWNLLVWCIEGWPAWFD